MQDSRVTFRGEGPWFLAVFLVALVVRFVYVWQLRDSPSFADPTVDQWFHHEWAKALAAGKTFLEPPFFRAPLYCWFLGGIYRLFGPDILAARLLQVALGAVNCGLLFLVGRIIFSRPVGLVAGFAAAGYWVFLFFDAALLSPVLVAFLNLLLIGGLCLTGARPQPWLWLANGVLLGLSAITRPDVLLFVPVLVGWIACLHWRRWLRKTRLILCFVAGCLIPILPLTLHNYLAGNDKVLIGTYGGVNFYMGNNPHADGFTAGIRGMPNSWLPWYEAHIARAETAAGRELKPSEVSRYYWRQAWEFITSQPGAELDLLAKKARYFWSRWEIPNNQDIHFITGQYTPIVRLLPLGFWLVGPLGFLGLLLCLPRWRDLLPLWGLVLVYYLVGIAFFVNARFRVFAVMLLILFAAQAGSWLWRALRARRWRSVGLAAVIMAGMGLVTGQVPPGVDVAGVQGARHAGFTLVSQGRFAEAEEMLGQALARERESGWSPRSEVWHALGISQVKQGKREAAASSFARVLEINPELVDARVALAEVLFSLHRYEDAAGHFLAAARQEPGGAFFLGRGGVALVLAGRPEEGERQLALAVAQDPAQVGMYALAADSLVARGRLGEAVRILWAGQAAAPGDWNVILPLIQLLAEGPDPALRAEQEAVRLAEQMAATTQGQDPLALFALAIAYASAGRTEEASAAANQAREAARRGRDSGLAAAIDRRFPRER